MFLFSSWTESARILVVGTLSYLSFLVLQRISAARTLSSLNAFDFVVTVAFGSVLASAVLDDTVSAVEAGLALSLLVGLQFAATWSTVRTRWMGRLVKSEPYLVVENGKMLRDRMRQQRVSEEEVLQVLREAGYGSLDQIAAVVLETNGHLSVVTEERLGSSETLRNVRR